MLLRSEISRAFRRPRRALTTRSCRSRSSLSLAVFEFRRTLVGRSGCVAAMVRCQCSIKRVITDRALSQSKLSMTRRISLIMCKHREKRAKMCTHVIECHIIFQQLRTTQRARPYTPIVLFLRQPREACPYFLSPFCNTCQRLQEGPLIETAPEHHLVCPHVASTAGCTWPLVVASPSRLVFACTQARWKSSAKQRENGKHADLQNACLLIKRGLREGDKKRTYWKRRRHKKNLLKEKKSKKLSEREGEEKTNWKRRRGKNLLKEKETNKYWKRRRGKQPSDKGAMKGQHTEKERERKTNHWKKEGERKGEPNGKEGERKKTYRKRRRGKTYRKRKRENNNWNRSREKQNLLKK